MAAEDYVESLAFPAHWDRKGDPIVVEFFKKLIISEILIPNMLGQMRCDHIVRLFEQSNNGTKIPTNWIKTANLILGYTNQKGEPFDFCVTGDCILGYSIISPEDILRRRQKRKVSYKTKGG